MQILSEAVGKAIEIAALHGVEVKVTSADWKPKQVVFMSEPITASLKDAITLDLPMLEHFLDEGSPHNPASEGFADPAEDVVVIFPTANDSRRWF